MGKVVAVIAERAAVAGAAAVVVVVVVVVVPLPVLAPVSAWANEVAEVARPIIIRTSEENDPKKNFLIVTIPFRLDCCLTL